MFQYKEDKVISYFRRKIDVHVVVEIVFIYTAKLFWSDG